MHEERDLCHRLGVRPVLNAMGMPTILGANTVPEGVRSAVDSILQVSVEIDELQAAACQLISRRTGAEAGCVTSSCSAALSICAAAAMTGPDLAKIARLPDTGEMPNQIVLPLAHDVNFGVPVSQMIRLSGAEVVRIGTASHFDRFHLRGVLSEKTAAIFYVDSGDVNPAGAFLSVDECVEIAGSKNLPVVVDTAAGCDVRPFLKAGADLVVTSAHKQMGAPTSGMICGRLDLIRACYLQNYGIGRAMKVGKEGIVGCMVALQSWYTEPTAIREGRWKVLAKILAQALPIRPGRTAYTVVCRIPAESRQSAQALANSLREGDPPVWVNRADNDNRELWLDLRVMTEDDAVAIAERITDAFENPESPSEDVPYHDLYWSERRLLEWPDWR